MRGREYRGCRTRRWRTGGSFEGFKDEYSQVQLQLLTAVVKLYLKKPSTQNLLQTILQSATAECDNPDIRDRAYVFWRLLSKDPAIARSIVLSDKPPITSTIPNLPGPLLESLLNEISTLASVYHKPPETFVGQGRFGADAVQKRAIEEQIQNARENPIQADTTGVTQANVENLLDIDFDGGAPASVAVASSSGLEDLMGGGPTTSASPAPASSGLDDLMGLGMGSPAPAQNGLINDFGGLDLSGSPQSPPQQSKKPTTNEDILGLF